MDRMMTEVIKLYTVHVFKLQHINGMAQIKQAKFGVIDMDFVLGVGGYDLER